MSGVAWERVQAYRRGWRHGACSSPLDPVFTEHATRRDLADEYSRGHEEGREARATADSAALERIGYRPNPLRGGGR